MRRNLRKIRRFPWQTMWNSKTRSGEVERPVLRPTAKERITSAMQALSDTLAGLRSPKGVHRAPERANKYKAQSHNTLQTEIFPKPNPSPLEMTRFDRERADKEKVLQLNRRGLTRFRNRQANAAFRRAGRNGYSHQARNWGIVCAIVSAANIWAAPISVGKSRTNTGRQGL